MDFQNVNSLNMKLNKFSGNLLPMTDRGSSFTIFWKLYGVLVTVFQLLTIIVMICGCVHVSRNKFIQDGMICLSTSGQITFMITQIHVRRNLVRQLIRKLNGILQTADENLKNIVTRTLRPTQIPLAFYAIISVISTIAWYLLPILNFEEKKVYWNEDYRMPTFFPNEPHSRRTFHLCNLFITFGGVYIILRKIAVDVYMIHLVLLMTTQYRYITVKIAMIFREKIEYTDVQRKYSSEVNRKQEIEMKKLCHYHNAVNE